MVDFCPHCGQVGGLVPKEQRLVCTSCGKSAGVISAVEPVVVREADELIREGAAAQCPVCQLLVELRGKTLARHLMPGTPRKVCPGSASPPASPAPDRTPQGGKDLGAHMTRETIRVVSCRKGAAPAIEELTLAYLDKRDRVRVQIEALRDILGPEFRLRDYPAALGRPQLAVWAGAAACVVGKRHEHGGYLAMSDADLAQVIADLQHHAASFFG